MNQAGIIDKTVSMIRSLDLDGLKVIRSTDYTQDRIESMCSVAVQDISRVNPYLDDYQITIDVILDCYITDDIDSGNYRRYQTALERYIKDIDKTSYDGLDVVGVVYQGCRASLTATSNQSTFTFQVFVSI